MVLGLSRPNRNGLRLRPERNTSEFNLTGYAIRSGGSVTACTSGCRFLSSRSKSRLLPCMATRRAVSNGSTDPVIRRSSQPAGPSANPASSLRSIRSHERSTGQPVGVGSNYIQEGVMFQFPGLPQVPRFCICFRSQREMGVMYGFVNWPSSNYWIVPGTYKED